MLTPSYMAGLLVGLGLLNAALIWVAFGIGKRYPSLGYLVTGSNIPLVPAALSWAIAWIWSPVILVGPWLAYLYGWVGLGWFEFGNALCLLYFGFFGDTLRKMHAEGFNAMRYAEEMYSIRFGWVLKGVLIIFVNLALAAQLKAIGGMADAVSGISPVVAMLLVLGIPLIYTFVGGWGAAIITNILQGVFVFLVGIVVLPLFLHDTSWEVLAQGALGKSGDVTSPFWGAGLSVTLGFGIPASLGLFAGPQGDPGFLGGVFSIKKEDVRRAFWLAAAIFVPISVGFGMFGIVAAGLHIDIVHREQVVIEMAQRMLPSWAFYALLAMLLSLLASRIAMSFANLNNLSGVKTPAEKVWAMAIYTSIIVAIAWVPVVSVYHLFMIYACLRSAPFASMTLITFWPRLLISGKSSVHAVFVGLLLGVPITIFGILSNSPIAVSVGTITAMFLPALWMRVVGPRLPNVIIPEGASSSEQEAAFLKSPVLRKLMLVNLDADYRDQGWRYQLLEYSAEGMMPTVESSLHDKYPVRLNKGAHVGRDCFIVVLMTHGPELNDERRRNILDAALSLLKRKALRCEFEAEDCGGSIEHVGHCKMDTLAGPMFFADLGLHRVGPDEFEWHAVVFFVPQEVVDLPLEFPGATLRNLT